MWSSTHIVFALATIFVLLPISSAWNITLFAGEKCDWESSNRASYANTGYSGSMHIAGFPGDNCIWVTSNGHKVANCTDQAMAPQPKAFQFSAGSTCYFLTGSGNLTQGAKGSDQCMLLSDLGCGGPTAQVKFICYDIPQW